MEEEILDVVEEEELEEDDFQIPDFLKETRSEEEIHKRMLNELPEDLDKSEGGYVYDLTRPTAIEVARMKEFELVEALKLIWPRFAEGIYLDYHAETRGLERKEAINASGKLYIEGKTGTLIPEGTIFTTESMNDEPEKEYETLEEAVIVENIHGIGSINVPVQSVEAGTNGNSAANTVILQEDIIDGIISVTNPEPVSGGMEAEDDESFRERIMEYDQTQGDSYIGNVSDYKRWALSVEGVGSATVISPQSSDESGMIRIVITDANGEIASKELCQAVEDYIMQPNTPENRLAPVNAVVRVEPQQNMPMIITADVTLKNADIESVTKSFQIGLKNYFKDTGDDGEIRYTQVCKILGNTFGVYDYANLTIGLANVEKTQDSVVGEKNIPVVPGNIPVIHSIVLTER